MAIDAKLSYAPAGEDLLAAHLLGKSEGVRYLDVGCLSPIESSTTYLFYRNGGSGVCIDANPDVAAGFRADRPRDVFLSAAVGAKEEMRTYHVFESPGMNTLSAPRAAWLAAHAAERPGLRLREKIELPVTSLDDVLGAVADGRLDGGLDFMSIDIEGLEYETLSAFSFDPRPRLVMCEQSLPRDNLPGATRLTNLMEERGYDQVAHTGHDVFFLDSRPDD